MLKAGFARLDVTPPLGSFVAGDFSERYSQTVLDPIYLNALALSYGEEKVVLIACDFLMISMKYALPLREKIARRVSLPVDNIMITALHQHTSIHIRDGLYNNVLEDTAYLDVLYRKFGDVAVMALDDLKDATLFSGERETDEQIAFIRRYYMKDGSIATNPGGRYQEVDRPYYEADNNVRLLRFKREGRKDIALVNFSTHADIIHKRLNSADWPGAVRSFVEKDLPEVSCLVTVGAEGDSNHANFRLPKYNDGLEHSIHMGRVIADSVLKLWDSMTERKVDRLTSQVRLLYNKTRTDGAERYEESKKLLEDHYAGRIKGTDYAVVGEARRIVELRDAPIYQKLPISVINLGDVAFVGFGGEPFTRYDRSVRAACPNHFILSSCCTNGGEGYLPIKEAFFEAGYEASCSHFSPNLEEDCVNMAAEMVNQ